MTCYWKVSKPTWSIALFSEPLDEELTLPIQLYRELQFYCSLSNLRSVSGLSRLWLYFCRSPYDWHSWVSLFSDTVKWSSTYPLHVHVIHDIQQNNFFIFLFLHLKVIMDSLLDDDICILNHEKEDFTRRQDTPFSASSGEASVASHFALVTAYEDIKKRLKDTERENYTLKRRLKQMDEKVLFTSNISYYDEVINIFTHVCSFWTWQ